MCVQIGDNAPASIQVSITLWKLTLKQKGETLFHHSKACSLQPTWQVNVPLGPTWGWMSIIIWEAPLKLMLFEESDEEPEVGIRNGNVNGCLSSLVETTSTRPHLSQPGQCGHKRTINYTMSWDEKSCTLKRNLASKIEIWNHFIFKCKVNSPQFRLTNFIYEPNTLPGVYYISQCYYYPHYFQQHCH